MAKISTTLEINRPIDVVCEYLTNVDNEHEWSTGLIEVTRDGPIRLGATGTDVRSMGRKRLEGPAWR